MLGATSTLLSTLETCGRNLLSHGHDPKCAVTFTEDRALSALATLQLKCRGYTESVTVIERRIEKLINLVSQMRCVGCNIATSRMQCESDW